MKVSLWAEIHRLFDIERLSKREITRCLHCSMRTVSKALEHAEPPISTPAPRGSIIDPFKSLVDKLIEIYPRLSSVRVLEEIKKKGYPGKISLVRKYVREIRPYQGRIYQEVIYDPGEAMQIDWGSCGSVPIGTTQRKVSVFVAVLCCSRLIYIEFALSQKKGDFYRCFVNALNFFGGTTEKCIVDNFRTAVADGSGRTARFQPEFLEFCGYHRITPIACERADPETKGVVEGGVRYVKKNALQGRDKELTNFNAYCELAVYWRDQIANVRDHETTGQRPIDRFEKERKLLSTLPAVPYDTDDIVTTVVTPHARIRFDTNRYSVPPEVVRKTVMIRANSERVRVFHHGAEIACHVRSYERRKIIINKDHQKAALSLRKRTRARQIEMEFDALGPEAVKFRKGLLTVPVKSVVHIRSIFSLVRLYGRDDVMGALRQAIEYKTFDSAYVRNLIDQERRRRHRPSPIPIVPKRQELIEDIDIPEPDLSEYDHFIDMEEPPE